MPSLTRVVLAKALDQVAQWHAQGQRLSVAVDLWASSLVDSDLPKQVASMLAARDVAPHCLKLEITEDFLMADRDRARAILTRPRHSGVQICVNDIGSGYGSLSYLRDLPMDGLKLAHSLLFPMADDDRMAALVASTIALAHSLGLRIVAEGVETDAAREDAHALLCPGFPKGTYSVSTMRPTWTGVAAGSPQNLTTDPARGSDAARSSKSWHHCFCDDARILPSPCEDTIELRPVAARARWRRR
jgi:predicted signal transduction protein with EAL and GGDEF domain